MKTGKGFSLLEVLIALTILAMGVIALMRLFPASLRQAQVAAERTIVAELAGSWLGRVQAVGARQFFQNQGRAIAFTLTEAQRAYSVYMGTLTTLQRMSGASEVYFQRVTFAVQLPDGRRETFVTYIAQR